MSIKLNEKYVRKFISADELAEMQSEISKAVDVLESRSGAGNDFLGWVDLPENYDKAEFL